MNLTGKNSRMVFEANFTIKVWHKLIAVPFMGHLMCYNPLIQEVTI